MPTLNGGHSLPACLLVVNKYLDLSLSFSIDWHLRAVEWGSHGDVYAVLLASPTCTFRKSFYITIPSSAVPRDKDVSSQLTCRKPHLAERCNNSFAPRPFIFRETPMLLFLPAVRYHQSSSALKSQSLI